MKKRFRVGQVWVGKTGHRRGITNMTETHVRSVDLESRLAFIMVTKAFAKWAGELYNPDAVYQAQLAV